jgi:hypothetical protein
MNAVETLLAWRSKIAVDMVATERQLEPAAEARRAAQAAADAAREEFRVLETWIAGKLRQGEPISDALRIRLGAARQARDAVIGQWSRAKAELANVQVHAADLRQAIEQVDRCLVPGAGAIEPDAGCPLSFGRRPIGPPIELGETIEFPRAPAA